MRTHLRVIVLSDGRIVVKVRCTGREWPHLETVSVQLEVRLVLSDIGDLYGLVIVWATFVSDCSGTPDCCSSSRDFEMVAHRGSDSLGRYLRL